MSETKKYGLQLAKSKKSIFKDEDDENDFKEKDEDTSTGGGYIDYMKQKANTKVEKQYKDALADDPTAFEYDSVYDEIKNEKEKKFESRQAANNTKESKYISTLMHQSNLKKKQYERVKENQILKERQDEGDTFKDKEVYVTQAYKRKLEQDKLEKERLEKEENEEQTKKKDISSFQRNLYSSLQQTDNNNNNKTTQTTTTTKSQQQPVKYNDSNNRSKQSNSNNNNSRYQEPQYYEKKKPIEKDEYERYNIRRNDENAIEEARKRYFERKKQSLH